MWLCVRVGCKKDMRPFAVRIKLSNFADENQSRRDKASSIVGKASSL